MTYQIHFYKDYGILKNEYKNKRYYKYNMFHKLFFLGVPTLFGINISNCIYDFNNINNIYNTDKNSYKRIHYLLFGGLTSYIISYNFYYSVPCLHKSIIQTFFKSIIKEIKNN